MNGIFRQAQDGVYWRGQYWRVAGGDGSSDGSGQEGSRSPSGPPQADQDSPSDSRLAEPGVGRAASRTAGRPDEVGTGSDPQGGAAGAHGNLDLVGELSAARERIAALESDLASAEAAGLAGQQALDAYRAQLIAENRDGIVEELVVGGTREALEASVEVARAAFARVAEAARLQALGERVPAGAGERGTSDLDGLSPLEKIARGLTK